MKMEERGIIKKALFMYYMNLIPGIVGFVMLIWPDGFQTVFNMPQQDPLIFRFCASVWLAFGIIFLAGLLNNINLKMVLLFQFFYKMLWLVSTCLANQSLPPYGWMFVAICFVYSSGALIAFLRLQR